MIVKEFIESILKTFKLTKVTIDPEWLYSIQNPCRFAFRIDYIKINILNEDEGPEVKWYSNVTQIPEEYLKGKLLRFDGMSFDAHGCYGGGSYRTIIEISILKDNSDLSNSI